MAGYFDEISDLIHFKEKSYHELLKAFNCKNAWSLWFCY